MNINSDKLSATSASMGNPPKKTRTQDIKNISQQSLNKLSTTLAYYGKTKAGTQNIGRTSLSTKPQQWNVHVKKVNVGNIGVALLFAVPLVLVCFCLPIDKAGMAFTNIHVKGLPHAPLWRFALPVYSVAQACKLQMQQCSLWQMLAQAVEHAFGDPHLRSTRPEEKKGDLVFLAQNK